MIYNLYTIRHRLPSRKAQWLHEEGKLVTFPSWNEACDHAHELEEPVSIVTLKRNRHGVIYAHREDNIK